MSSSQEQLSPAQNRGPITKRTQLSWLTRNDFLQADRSQPPQRSQRLPKLTDRKRKKENAAPRLLRLGKFFYGVLPVSRTVRNGTIMEIECHG